MRVLHTPDFLRGLVGPGNPMWISVMNTRPLDRAAYRKSGYLAASCELWEMSHSFPDTLDEPQRLVG
jgi:hypothetical protein